jgi:hypothetical protein
VSKCLDTDKVLTIERQRLFSKRAREYMVAYNTLDNQKVDAMDETKGNVHKNPSMSAYLIEKIVKQYKTHRSAADFDSGFVDKVVDAMKGLMRTSEREKQQHRQLLKIYNENINENKILKSGIGTMFHYVTDSGNRSPSI